MDTKEWDTNMAQLKRELRLTRIFCGISSMLTICVLLGGILLFKEVQPVFEFMQQAQPVMEQLSQLNVDEINLTLEQVNATLGSVDWEQVAESMNELDVDAINEAIEGLDTEEISEAIENLNKTVDVLEGIGEKFASFFKSFGK